MLQAAIHETNGADILLTAYEPTRGLQQARDRRRSERDVESVRAMIIPYGIAFDLRWRQRQAGNHHTHETLSRQIDPLAEHTTRNGQRDARTPIRMGQGMQERPACRLVHARRLPQQIGFQGSPLELDCQSRAQRFQETEGRHEDQMMSGTGLGRIDDQPHQCRRRSLPGHLPQIEIRHQQHLAVFRWEGTRQPQAQGVARQPQHRIQQMHGREGCGKQNETLPVPMLPGQGGCGCQAT